MALLYKLFYPFTSSSATATTNQELNSTVVTTTTTAASTNVRNLSNEHIKIALTTTAASGTGATPKLQQQQQQQQKEKAPGCQKQTKHLFSKFPFDGSQQVRILLFRECDSRGRRILFDSNALEKVYLKKAKDNLNSYSNHKREKHSNTTPNNITSDITADTNFINVCKEYGFKHNRPKTEDIACIGEMVFGALAMSYCGTTLKLHWLQDPSRMLCSQVFLTPIRSATNMMPASSSLCYTISDATIAPQTNTNATTTMSMHKLDTPRTSISSDQSSIDGISMNTFPITPFIDKSLLSSSPICRLQLNNSNLTRDSGLGLSSSAVSSRTDSASSTISRRRLSAMSNAYWPYSYQMSLRSSLSSVKSDQQQQLSSKSPELFRKLSIDSSYYPKESTHISRNLPNDFQIKKRISRNLITSLENENSVNDFVGYLSDHYIMKYYKNSQSNENSLNLRPSNVTATTSLNDKMFTHNNSEIEHNEQSENVLSSVKVKRRPRLGLALYLTFSDSYEEEMELFCSEHIALIECLINRLRAKTEQAYTYHKNFLKVMYNTWQDAQQWFQDLFLAPRIKTPVWLSITTMGSKYSKNIAERFIKELCWLLSIADTKQTNFFISTLITAILTYHSGWISTIHSSQTTLSDIEMVKMNLLTVSQKYPYNPLWAQIGDLYGANSMPPKLSRTIVYGKEKLYVERLLHVLTYFIRCSEVRRSTKVEVLNKENLKELMTIKNNSINNTNTSESVNHKKSLRRNQTLKNNLNVMMADDASDNEDIKKKNDIPIVLAYRDSHFVQQELRIGNYLMDTGIEKVATLPKANIINNLNRQDFENYGCTSISIPDAAVEAIVIDTLPVHEENNRYSYKEMKNNKLSFCQTANSSVPIDETVSLQSTIKEDIPKQTTSFKVQRTQQPCAIKELSLSELITQNSLGLDNSERLQWGIEPIKENVTLEEHMHFDVTHKLIMEQKHHNNNNNTINNTKGQHRDVVFVLGDNEPLVNIKQTNENLLTSTITNTTNEKDLIATITTISNGSSNNYKKYNETLVYTCPLHRNSVPVNNTLRKSQTSVRFNFEQYPQIINNYMKNKNFTIQSNYNYVNNKAIETIDSSNSKVKVIDNNSNKNMESEKTIEKLKRTKSNNTLMDVMAISKQCPSCDICDNSENKINYYQTPSNATEVDFEDCLSLGSIKQFIDERGRDFKVIKTNDNNNDDIQKQRQIHNEFQHQSEYKQEQMRFMQLLELPMPSIKDSHQDIKSSTSNYNTKTPAGLIPSLFLDINDHYIHDVVLQGTTAPPIKWEQLLQDDLTIATHSAALISLPLENVAIVANMENWDVKLLSSTQFQHFNRYNTATNQYTPIGMSQLVSSILETVQTMRCVGVSAYECLSFIELKLQEIYMHSETLAAFLMETDFCSLSTITTALNLTDNDVPLLLSVATVHTPQIAKKCGITLR